MKCKHWLFALLLLVSVSHAKIVTLRNIEGIEIRAEIIAVTESTVTLKRFKDGKVFTIEINLLDKESVGIINDWRDVNANLPKKPMSFSIRVSGNQNPLEVNFLLPEGDYNSVVLHNRVRANFDTGRLELDFYKDNRKQSEILQALEKGNEESLGKLTPKERATIEPRVKLEPVKYGQFQGYLFKGFPVSAYGYFFNGKIGLGVDLFTNDESPIQEKHLPAIIATISVKEK